MSPWDKKEKGRLILMKKLTALLLALSFALIIPVFSSAQPETQSAPVIARAATHFTCGEMQTGSFGSFPETHSYTFTFRAIRAWPL